MNKKTSLLDKCKSLSMINLKKISLSSKDFTYLIDNDIIFVDTKFKKAFINLLESQLNKENHSFLSNIISILMFEEEDISFCLLKMKRETVLAKLTALYEVDNERQRNDQVTDQETRLFISG